LLLVLLVLLVLLFSLGIVNASFLSVANWPFSDAKILDGDRKSSSDQKIAQSKRSYL